MDLNNIETKNPHFKKNVKVRNTKRLETLTEKIIFVNGKRVRVLKTQEPKRTKGKSLGKTNNYFKTLKNNNLIN